MEKSQHQIQTLANEYNDITKEEHSHSDRNGPGKSTRVKTLKPEFGFYVL